MRAGYVPLEGVLEHLDRVTRALDTAGERPGLRDRPDVDAVDRFVVRAYRAAWDVADVPS